MSIQDSYFKPDAGTMRVLFLYVGQGEATLFFLPNGGAHTTMLVDCNRSPTLRGIDLARLLGNLPKASGDDHGRTSLDLFVNTHPHADHLGGLQEIRDAVKVAGVWHSGHKPGKEHDDAYKQLVALGDEVKERGGSVEVLKGSRTPRSVGQAIVHVLAPAAYVSDDIDEESADERYRRIHEQCAVLRVRWGSTPTGVLITGDSDKAAWKEHICAYHGEGDENRVESEVLSASHHGSRTFFKEDEDDEEPYTAHLDAIDPTHIVISAPDRKDSPHDHPHEDAVEYYERKVGAESIHHMGSRRWSFVLDVAEDGAFDLYSDRGEIAEEYGLEPPEDDGGGGKARRAAPTIVISRVERSRPMGG